ncbi:MAG TPA: DNA-directed RNA polymerase subunit beta' [bacterium]|nr:DNA-directed RNA polymerase subunit beta' [bacterium]
MEEKFKEFASIKVGLASPDYIKERSNGQVTKPETINYRTLKPEPQSLFCERIFGPTKDWECSCGNYKSIRYKGVVCDRCKVEVTHSKVRRERMGHIALVTPVSHIWFFKGSPSVICMILDMRPKDLEKILYYQSYVVTEVIGACEAELRIGDLLTEDKLRELRDKYGKNFEAMMGAEAIKKMLKEVKIKELQKNLRDDIQTTKSQQKRKNMLRRLEVVNSFADSDNLPEWMILDYIPVIPPELRPMVQLEGGRFATSDINDLYRRIINRNNRLKRLLELNAPEIIIRNEKRMLQEAVDALFDNGRHGRIVRGLGNRPLKSLSELIKGKQGRFRQNLLGKRVDYSGRSVIVIGPQLKMNQCGLPKLMALELFKPFIMNKLLEKNIVHNIKTAKKMVESHDDKVWEVLEEVIENHPVLLNRAPTLHRLGIQAFMPVLVEGKAIRLHPLVCVAFNADFDGDQMAVHIPLSKIAQTEAKHLMMSTNNILSPASGKPIVTPTQDIILGLYCLSREPKKVEDKKTIKKFSSSAEIILAFDEKKIEINAPIYFKPKGYDKYIETTVGRVLLNEELPEEIEYINDVISKKNLSKIIFRFYKEKGAYITIRMLDSLKKLGYHYSTMLGISIGLGDLIEIPAKKEIIEKATEQETKVRKQFFNGQITDQERYNQIVGIWSNSVDKIKKVVMDHLGKVDQGNNSLFLMADSGARGSVDQIRQLAGMRGLMAKPSGEIIELPIKASFKEGLTVLEYFISTNGARKGLADTALKTANAGYLTRRLVDVAQDVVIRNYDCGTINGITVSALKSSEGEKELETLKQRIVGRVSVETITHPGTGETLVEANELLTEETAEAIEKAGIERVDIRSVMTCEEEEGICAKCYGQNLANGRLVEVGEAVGIMAAQSIGEPGTQLTMRTFHLGGVATGGGVNDIKLNYSVIVEELPKHIIKKEKEIIVFRDDFLAVRKILAEIPLVKDVKQVQPEDFWVNKGDVIAQNKDKSIVITAPAVGIIRYYKEKNKILIIGEDHKVPLPIGSKLRVQKDEILELHTLIAEADPYNEPILAEVSGKIIYEEIVPGRTVKEEHDVSGMMIKKIIEDREKKLQPVIIIEDKKAGVFTQIDLPYDSHLIVDDGDKVVAGDIIAKIPSETSKTKDITGGLPRVEELVEARIKKSGRAIISEIDGEVSLPERKKGALTREIVVTNPNGMEKRYEVPVGRHLKVHSGDQVKAGDQLIDGQVNPHDILRVKGEKELATFLIREIQEVYCSQNVEINDKHFEVIIRQMLRKYEVIETGETKFLLKQKVSKQQLYKENERVIKIGGKPAKARPILLGITRASLETDSFVSAASFQETRQVLTESAIASKVDTLKGLKENVIIGHLITCGTGLRKYRKAGVAAQNIIEKIEKFERNEVEKIAETEPQLVEN